MHKTVLVHQFSKMLLLSSWVVIFYGKKAFLMHQFSKMVLLTLQSHLLDFPAQRKMIKCQLDLGDHVTYWYHFFQHTSLFFLQENHDWNSLRIYLCHPGNFEYIFHIPALIKVPAYQHLCTQFHEKFDILIVSCLLLFLYVVTIILRLLGMSLLTNTW